MEPLSVSHPGAGRIAAALEASLDGMVAAAVEAIWEQVPAYRACQDDRLREQVAGHVRAVFRAFLMWLAGGRVAQQADFTVTREQAARRVAQRISLADFLKALPTNSCRASAATVGVSWPAVEVRDAQPGRPA